MRRMRPGRLSRGLLTVLIVLAALTGAVPATPAQAVVAMPTAVTAIPNPKVGPLFFGAVSGGHSCTASVLYSSTHDLILTAAHCMSGSGRGTLFAPGYDRGATPYGLWTVVRSYVDSRWLGGQDPNRDVAVLQVAPRLSSGRSVRIQELVGGYRLGVPPVSGSSIALPGYVAGINDSSMTCRNGLLRTADRFPQFDCHGYFTGTSGSPFIWRNPASGVLRTVGVIGGLHQGGCHDYISYSSPFDAATVALLGRAQAHGPGDVVPDAADSGC